MAIESMGLGGVGWWDGGTGVWLVKTVAVVYKKNESNAETGAVTHAYNNLK